MENKIRLGIVALFLAVFGLYFAVTSVPRMLREGNYEYVKADLVSCKPFKTRTASDRTVTRYSCRWVYITNGQLGEHYTTAHSPIPADSTRMFYVNRENVEDVSFPLAGQLFLLIGAAFLGGAFLTGREVYRSHRRGG